MTTTARRAARPAWVVPVGVPLALALVAGLLLTCAPDPMWDLQHFSNSLDGRVSRRGEAWELRRKVLAFISFPLAALLFYIGFTS